MTILEYASDSIELELDLFACYTTWSLPLTIFATLPQGLACNLDKHLQLTFKLIHRISESADSSKCPACLATLVAKGSIIVAG